MRNEILAKELDCGHLGHAITVRPVPYQGIAAPAVITGYLEAHSGDSTGIQVKLSGEWYALEYDSTIEYSEFKR